jgi:hypothetical protein
MYGAIFLCLHAHYKAKHAVPLSPTPTRPFIHSTVPLTLSLCEKLQYYIRSRFSDFIHNPVFLALISFFMPCTRECTLYLHFLSYIRFFVVGCFYKMLHLMSDTLSLFVFASNEHFNELFSSRNYYLKLESSL